MTRKILFMFSIFVSAIILSQCGTRNKRSEDRPPVIKIGHVGHDHHIALYVAAFRGEKYKKHGVWMVEKKEREVYDLMKDGKAIAELHLLKVGGGSAMPAAVERGEIQVGLGGTAAVAVFRDKGSPIRIICPLQTDGDMVVVDKDSPADDWDSFVEYVRNSDKPVKMGYKAPDAVAKMIFEMAMKEIQLPYTVPEDPSGSRNEPGSVELINMQDERNMVPALASKSIHGFVVNQPHASIAEDKGVGKVIADISDLPPEGRWKQHPCCCICATEQAIKEHREILTTLMELIIIATDEINADKTAAAKIASEWTRTPLEIELKSIPYITYEARFADDYRRGIAIWGELMNDIGKFKGDLKGKQGDELFNLLCEPSLVREAEIRLKGKGIIR